MKNLITLLLLAVLFTAGQSCTDLLERTEPSTSISGEVALTDPGAIQALRARLMGRLHSFTYTTDYMLGPSVLADGLYSRPGTNRFSGYAENSVNSGLLSWGTAYNVINEANTIIHAIKEDVDLPIEQYQAEALFMRAFAMHHLVRAAGYEPGMQPGSGQGVGWDLGIILRTQPVLSPEEADYRPRKTVRVIYDQIKDDLTTAITMFQNSGDAGQVIYPTEAAAQALMARVSLYDQEYADAENYAAAALANSPATLQTGSDVADIFDETAGLNPEGIFITDIDPSTESLGANSSLNSYTARLWMAQNPTQDLLDLYETDDERLAWFGECFDENASLPVNCIANHPDVPGSSTELQKWNAEQGQGQYADDIPLFRVPEMLLIQAEARVNDPTLGDPLTPINTLRNARGLGDLLTVDIDDILEERRREFAGEGQRFWDLKRLGRDIRKAPGTGQSDVNYIDFRVLDNIPFGEVDLSQENAPHPDSVLVQNPGY